MLPFEDQERQLRKKFKHAPDFGVHAPPGPAGWRAFYDAVAAHLAEAEPIAGTYRGEARTLCFCKRTGLVAIFDGGLFVSGWLCSPAQARAITERGALS